MAISYDLSKGERGVHKRTEHGNLPIFSTEYGNIAHIVTDFENRNTGRHGNFYFYRYLTDISK